MFYNQRRKGVGGGNNSTINTGGKLQAMDNVVGGRNTGQGAKGNTLLTSANNNYTSSITNSIINSTINKQQQQQFTYDMK